MGKKKTLKEAKEIFEAGGCELLASEYINSGTPMEYRCSCGNIAKVCLGNFQRGLRCGCRMKNPKNKFTIDQVKEYFSERGCVLLEDIYVNSHAKMKYQCSCGNISYIRFYSFKEGHRCNKCSSSRGERRIRNFLKRCSIVFEEQKEFPECRSLRLLKFDFYIPSLKLVIEFQGRQHFDPYSFGSKKEKHIRTNFEKGLERDLIKKEFIKTSSLTLLEINYKEYTQIEKILSDFLNVN